MAIVEHTPYNGSKDCSETNRYLVDGHELESFRTNRYFGHNQPTPLGSYNCPADPELATIFMETLRCNYERQHPLNSYRTKGYVTHHHIYFSPTEGDNVPVHERMEMVRELIERTELRNFACLYAPHDNRPNKHCHISVCPYSLPDKDGKTHKLSMNNTLLYELRRQADRICYEHGYSIVESHVLWGDADYKAWFQHVQEEGAITIHPPRVTDLTDIKREGKRMRDYATAKQSQRLQEEKQAAYIKYMTRSYNEKTADFFYEMPHLYHPANPHTVLHIRKSPPKGKEYNDLEKAAVALNLWSYLAEDTLKKRNIPGSAGLQTKLQRLSRKTADAYNFIHETDICTHAELINHIKECGSDISELKQDISRQDSILKDMSATMGAIDRWENQHNPDAFKWLADHGIVSAELIADAKKRYTRALTRKETNETLLQSRKSEYGQLKNVEQILHPASSKEELQAYLETAFKDEIKKKVGFVDDEKLKKSMLQMGKIVGVSPEEIKEIFDEAKEIVETTEFMEYRIIMKNLHKYDDAEKQISMIYDRMRFLRRKLRSYHNIPGGILLICPFTVLLGLALAVYVGTQQYNIEKELKELEWELETMKEYAKETRRIKRDFLQKAKAYYDEEIVSASEEEIEAARTRFYQRVIDITGGFDILIDTGIITSNKPEDKKHPSINEMIQGAASQVFDRNKKKPKIKKHEPEPHR